jgi:hypothetical protein
VAYGLVLGLRRRVVDSYKCQYFALTPVLVDIHITNAYALLEIEPENKFFAIHPPFMNYGGLRIPAASLCLHSCLYLRIYFVLFYGVHFVSPYSLLVLLL